MTDFWRIDHKQVADSEGALGRAVCKFAVEIRDAPKWDLPEGKILHFFVPTGNSKFSPSHIFYPSSFEI
jgi:hypothetical protein